VIESYVVEKIPLFLQCLQCIAALMLMMLMVMLSLCVYDVVHILYTSAIKHPSMRVMHASM